MAENKVFEFPAENNKNILKQKKFKIAEYLHTSIFKMGFYEGLTYNQSKSKES
ncbi:hypothetical protein [Carnobacterium maltaromaticum]|uniref:hypothetical protein n=1 Tax=Carnobacterium maltaromaticum TaxID=2751 RepID=UPI0039B04467